MGEVDQNAVRILPPTLVINCRYGVPLKFGVGCVERPDVSHLCEGLVNDIGVRPVLHGGGPDDVLHGVRTCCYIDPIVGPDLVAQRVKVGALNELVLSSFELFWKLVAMSVHASENSLEPGARLAKSPRQ